MGVCCNSCNKEEAVIPIEIKQVSSHPGNGVWTNPEGTKEATIVNKNVCKWVYKMSPEATSASDRLTEDVFKYPTLGITQLSANWLYDRHSDTWIEIPEPDAVAAANL